MNNNPDRKWLSAVYFLATSFAASSMTYAQNIDYGSLEALFGEKVTTSATGKPQRVSEVPVPMEILGADAIRRSGANTIPDVLKQLSGINVLQWSKGHQDVAIRGSNQAYSPRLLVLVNGRQVYLDDYGYTAWSTIPVQLEEIRQIEVVKGPNTALFGFNAVAGVINIVTYHPIYDDKSSVGITTGTGGHRQAHYVQSVKINEHAGVRLSAGRTNSDEFGGNRNGNLITRDDVRRESVNLDGAIQLADGSQLRIEGSGSRSLQSDMIPIYTMSETDYQTNSINITYTTETAVGSVRATAYQNSLDADYNAIGGLKIDNRVRVFQLEDLFKVGADHSFRVMGEYRNNTASGTLFAFNTSDMEYDVFAVSGMWNWAINERWELTNAVRADYLELNRHGGFLPSTIYTDDDFDQNVTAVSYNGGLVWKATDKDTFRFGIGRGIQAPSQAELGVELSLGPATFVGNPRVDPSVVLNYELGWDRQLAQINGLLRTAIFYQQTKDVKSLAASFPSPGVLQTDNVGDSESIGVELGLDGRIGDVWTWGLNYTGLAVNDSFGVNQGMDPFPVGVNFENTTPTSALNAHIGYQNGPWEADIFTHYVSNYRTLRGTLMGTFTLEDISNYVSVSGRVGYKVTKGLTLAVAGQDIQTSGDERTSGLDVKRTVLFSITNSF